MVYMSVFFDSIEFGPKFRRPSAFRFTDLTTGRQYEIANPGLGLSIVYDSPSVRTPNGYSSKKEYLERQHGREHLLVMGGPYDDIFTYKNDFLDPVRLGIDDNSGMLYLVSQSVVVRRPLRDGRTMLLQHSIKRDKEKTIDAYLLSTNPEISSGDKLLRDVCDLSNPRLGLLRLNLNGRLFLGNEDELWPYLRYESFFQGGAFYHRGDDPFTRLPVLAPLLPIDLAEFEKKGLEIPNVPTSQEIQSMLEARLVEKHNIDLLKWNDETLKREEHQTRLWGDFSDGRLWRHLITLQADEPYSSSIFTKNKKARFNERDAYICPRLQVTYLY